VLLLKVDGMKTTKENMTEWWLCLEMRCRSEMRRGFRIEGYFDLHNIILKIFWCKLKSLEVFQKVLGGTGRSSPDLYFFIS